MTRIFVHGLGAVSPAGWGMAALRTTLQQAGEVPTRELARPGWAQRLRVRPVPSPSPRPGFLAHPRLRRSSPISQYAAAAALEALGMETPPPAGPSARLGIVLCVMSGCVNYSRRFYDEVLHEPATASPLLFPETVFNAPSSHLSALLGSPASNYTLVGDPGAFLQGLALAAQWLVAGQVDGCLVVGAEENDWLTANAFRLFARRIVLSEGAGALYLRTKPPPGRGVELRAVTSANSFSNADTRRQAARKVRMELPQGVSSDLLCDGLQDIPRFDAPERLAWKDWPGARLSPKRKLGEGLMAAAAWQCVAAIDLLRQGQFASACVSVLGCNQQAIGAHFVPTE